jgi:hypothetical protein
MVNKNVYQVKRKVSIIEYSFGRAMYMTIEAERVWLMVLVQLEQDRIVLRSTT